MSRGISTRTSRPRKLFPRTCGPVTRCRALTKHPQPPREHHSSILGSCIGLRCKSDGLKSRNPRGLFRPLADRNFHASQPVACHLEPLGRGPTTKSEERWLIQIQPRATFVQAANEPVAPSRDTEHIA